MSCSVSVCVTYSKELEEKIMNISGIILIPENVYSDFQTVRVPDTLFSQHEKDVDAHRWVVRGEGVMSHFPENPGKWEYKGHGFEIWLGFEGDIVFVASCHWNPDHGHWTIIDIEKWIEDNLGDVEIKEENESY